MDIAARIKELRTAKGYTVNKLANLAGVSQSYLRDIELGNKQPTVEYLSYICDALGVSLETFFSDEKTKDELLRTINALSPVQRKYLIEFLKTL
jgi:transcriptional regulator with XRE-family HTH domain